MRNYIITIFITKHKITTVPRIFVHRLPIHRQKMKT